MPGHVVIDEHAAFSQRSSDVVKIIWEFGGSGARACVGFGWG